MVIRSRGKQPNQNEKPTEPSPAARCSSATRRLLRSGCSWLISVFLTVSLLGVTPATPQTATSNSVRLVVSPSRATLRPGEAVQFSVHAFERTGSELPLSGLRWSSSRSSVLTVSGSGIATAQQRAGSATVSVNAAGVTARVTVAVVAGLDPDGLPVAAELKQVEPRSRRRELDLLDRG